MCRLFEGIKQQCQRAGAIPQVEQLLQKQQAVRSRMRRTCRRHLIDVVWRW